ncbi:Clavaminate synthase-like protein [Aspergillus ellipticus CBS 707.79]|uniref:Clavaminate synthase-like protein n=1 Tax=Aspergillus ellipticus CBS 707.79 TaxID=1448320 RepID=A0A319CUH7_9EURO|nr:Clavaminate synthase-like protein [Aspergillus ellipticus CBS 707.79]
MHILESYSVNCKPSGTVAEDVATFLPTIVSYIERQEPVRMVLPAFPFKSPNAHDKALGALPDLAEELALYHLNGLCQNIGRVYEPGAEVHITSDGLVYNDLMGVLDETVWEYGETLRKMAVERKLRHVRFIRLAELLDHHPCSSRDPESAKAFYLAHAPCLRRELMIRFGDPSFSPDTAIKTDMDVCLTYRGYIKFLTKDLAQKVASKSKRARAEEIAQTARSMIVRGQMFAAAIRAQRGDYVRLSIHESAKGRKLSVPLIPQKPGSIGHTPWHSCVAVGVDGSYRATHVDQVRDTHDLVYKDGQPYYYRERSELFDWAADGIEVEFEPLYPCGLIIRPAGGASQPPSIRSIPMRKIRQLSCHMSPVVCRGFADTGTEDMFVDKAAELGKVAAWSQDIIVKVRDSGRQDKKNNNVKSNEAMPMHFDGMFRFEHKVDPKTGETVRVQNIPRYQFFTCRATAPEDDGYTLFANSRLFFRHLPLPWSAERLQQATWSMENDGFWDAKVYNLPLVIAHPVSGLPCLRWHQPWGAQQTKFSTCDVTIHNANAGLIPQIDDLTYDYRVCKRFAWHVGDVLVSDNISMLHTRTAYTSDCDRELWRIHCD